MDKIEELRREIAEAKTRLASLQKALEEAGAGDAVESDAERRRRLGFAPGDAVIGRGHGGGVFWWRGGQ